MSYRGRFAPSPTGPLHFGSLVAASASYLQARHSDGLWHLRVEDIDPPREIAGATDSILTTLEQYGFEWDGSVLYQSQRLDIYREVANELVKDDLAYFCTCSRKQIRATAVQGPGGPIYPGNCREKKHPGSVDTSIRLVSDDRNIHFSDLIQGQYDEQLNLFCGDYIIYRSGNLPAYQLAVVVDDAAQQITEVFRGSDLITSTSRQIVLQQQLGYSTPTYAHHPIAINQDGQKLSKQTFASAITADDAPAQLWRALSFLGQRPPTELKTLDLLTIWEWAIKNWSLAAIPSKLEIAENIALDNA